MKHRLPLFVLPAIRSATDLSAPAASDEDTRPLLCCNLCYTPDSSDAREPDYPSETFGVLKEREIRHHGEYRTRRLVLAAWGRMEAGGEFTAMGM